ncbi:hypothetical protein MNBD_ALPHA12-455, partial [hydrothermal vent metagenome]
MKDGQPRDRGQPNKHRIEMK